DHDVAFRVDVGPLKREELEDAKPGPSCELIERGVAPGFGYELREVFLGEVTLRIVLLRRKRGPLNVVTRIFSDELPANAPLEDVGDGLKILTLRRSCLRSASGKERQNFVASNRCHLSSGKRQMSEGAEDALAVAISLPRAVRPVALKEI